MHPKDFLEKRWAAWHCGDIPTELLRAYKREVAPLLNVCTIEDPYILTTIENLILRHLQIEAARENLLAAQELRELVEDVRLYLPWVAVSMGILIITFFIRSLV